MSTFGNRGLKVASIQPLKSKQGARNEDFDRVWANIGRVVSRAHIESLVDAAAREVRAMANGKRAAFGYSAGKDSIALEVVCGIAGVMPCVWAACSLEWPAMDRWVELHGPKELTVIRHPTLTMESLVQRPEILFPIDGKLGYFWTSKVTHAGQQRYYADQKLDVMFYGRRHQDGNFIGKGGVHTNKDGFTQHSPLRDWTHEEVLGAIHYFGKAMPPIYSWPNCWKSGTGPWAGRHFATHAAGWAETFIIDPDVVRKASEIIPSAREFMSSIR